MPILQQGLERARSASKLLQRGGLREALHFFGGLSRPIGFARFLPDGRPFITTRFQTVVGIWPAFNTHCSLDPEGSGIFSWVVWGAKPPQNEAWGGGGGLGATVPQAWSGGREPQNETGGLESSSKSRGAAKINRVFVWGRRSGTRYICTGLRSTASTLRRVPLSTQ